HRGRGISSWQLPVRLSERKWLRSFAVKGRTLRGLKSKVPHEGLPLVVKLPKGGDEQCRGGAGSAGGAGVSITSPCAVTQAPAGCRRGASGRSRRGSVGPSSTRLLGRASRGGRVATLGARVPCAPRAARRATL